MAERTNRGSNGDRDPSENVRELTQEQGKRIEQAAVLREKRQDDLRKMELAHRLEMRHSQEKFGKEIAGLREQLAAKETERLNAINLADSRQHAAERFEDKAAVTLANAEARGTAAALQARQDAAAEALSETKGGRVQTAIGRQGNQFVTQITLTIIGLIIAGAVFFGLSQNKPTPTPVTITVVAPTPTPSR